jgi:hypothetical protein
MILVSSLNALGPKTFDKIKRLFKQSNKQKISIDTEKNGNKIIKMNQSSLD